MAFRTHELNLMIRVQDRASARLRRVASDLGGVNRVAELQRNAGRIAMDQERNIGRQVKLRQGLMERLESTSIRSIGNERKMLDLGAKRLDLMQRFAKDPSLANKMRVKAIDLQILEAERLQSAEITNINRKLTEEAALQKTLATQAAANAAALATEQRRASIARTGRNIRHVGGAAALIGGAGLAVGAGLSGGFAEFNRQAVRAATQLRAPGEGMKYVTQRAKELQQTIVGLSQKFPATMTEMADSAYEIASGMNLVDKNGQPLTTSLGRLAVTTNLLGKANKVAVAGGIDLKSATDAMIVTLNNYGGPLNNTWRSQKLVNQTLNTLFATVKYGKGSFDQFAPVFGKMSAGAKIAHQSLTDAGGAVAFLSTKMSSQSQAVVGYIRLLQIFQRREFQAGFKAMFGVSELLPGTDKLRPLQQLIAIMLKARPALATGGQGAANIISDITAAGDIALGAKKSKGLQGTSQARTALQQLLVGWKDYADILASVKVNTDEFDKSYRAMSQAPGVRWQVAINQFKAFAIVIGQDVLPVMLRLFAYIQGLIQRWQNLSGHTRRIITQFAIVGSAISFLAGVVSILVGSLVGLYARFGNLFRILGGAGGGGVAGRATVLLTALRGIAAIGVISLTISLLLDRKGVGWKDKITMAALAVALGFKAGGIYGAAAVAGAEAATVAGGRGKGHNLGKKVLGFLMDTPAENYRKAIHDTAKDRAKKAQEAQIQAAQDIFNRTHPGLINKAKQQGTQIAGILASPKMKFQFVDKDTVQAFSAFDKLAHTFKRGSAGFSTAIALSGHALEGVKNANTKATDNILKDWQNLTANLTGLNYLQGINQQTLEGVSNLEIALSKAQSIGNVPQIRSAALGLIKFLDKEEAKLEKIKHRSPAQQARLNQLYQKEAQLRGLLTAQTNKHTAAEKKATAEQTRKAKALEAANNKLETAKQRVESLKLSLQGLKEQELDKLTSVFGQLFQGPVASGPLGSMFTQINQTLQGFGLKGIPVPITLILQDQAQQQRQFDTFTKDLTKLAAKVPKKFRNDFTQQIRDMGSGATQFMEGILSGSGAQQNQFVQNFVKGRKAIQATTKSPWETQLSAANIQYKAAMTNLAIAQGKVTKAKTGVTTANAKPTGAKPTGTTRTTQSAGGHTIHYHGDTITVHSDETNAQAIKRYFDSAAFKKKHGKK